MIGSAQAADIDVLMNSIRQPDGTLPALPSGCEDVDREKMWKVIVQKFSEGQSKDILALIAMYVCKLHGEAVASREAVAPAPSASVSTVPRASRLPDVQKQKPSAPVGFEAVDVNPHPIDTIASPAAKSLPTEALVSNESYNRHGGAWMNPDGHVVVKACATPEKARKWATGEGKDESCRLIDMSEDGYVSIQKDAIEEGDLGPTYDLIRAKDDAMLYVDNRWRD